jgi:hypothetical protein
LAAQDRDGDGLRDEVVACAERTLSAPLVRVEYSREVSFAWPKERLPKHRTGGVLRPVGRLIRAGGRAAGRAAWRRWGPDAEPGHLTAEGLIEPPLRRYMVDFGSYAEIYKDGARWGGRSGRSLAMLTPWPPDRQVHLWWLLDVLRGTAGCVLEGEEALRDVPCRRLAVSADLERASALVPGGLTVPSVDRVEDLRALPLTVWIDGRHVRRVRFGEHGPASSTLTLDLLDFDPGVAAEELDWERLPTFRSPEEAAAVRDARR